jgi:hypothetical protein
MATRTESNSAKKDGGRRKESRRRGKKLRENFSTFSELMKNSRGHARKNGRNGNNSTQQKIYRKNKQRSSYGKGIHVYH